MNQETNPNPRPAAESHESAPEQDAISPHKILTGAAVVLLILAVLAVTGILRRMHAHTVLAERTHDLAAPTVTLAPARPGAPVDNFVLPGNVTAYTDAPIYARTDGYLVHWYYDIGTYVRKGALLATIDTPELDRQVAQAEADLATAQTNAGNAKVQANRYSGLVKSDAVSQIDADTFNTQAAATASAVKSAQANLQRLKELQSFEKVYAPFDGVVTARAVDTGQLINQGSGAELFHMQAIETLRVYANVPQVYAQTLKRGMKIDLTFPEHPGKIFVGTLVRTADAIDPASRTLLAEIDINNRSRRTAARLTGPGPLQNPKRWPHVYCAHGGVDLPPQRRNGAGHGGARRCGAPGAGSDWRGRWRHGADCQRPEFRRPDYPGSARLAD